MHRTCSHRAKTPQNRLIFQSAQHFRQVAEAVFGRFAINAHSYTVITAHKSKVNVMEITSADYLLLEDFSFHAIFVPPGAEAPPQGIIYNPDGFIYIDGFAKLFYAFRPLGIASSKPIYQ